MTNSRVRAVSCFLSYSQPRKRPYIDMISPAMQRVSSVTVACNQTITLPAKITYQSVAELAIERAGDVITLKLVRLLTESFWDRPEADPDFL